MFVCPDNIRNYITKFVSNDWMYEKGFITEEECMNSNIPKLIPNNTWGQNFTIKDLPLQEAFFLDSTMTCREAIDAMKKHNFDQFPVRNAEGKTVGMVKLNDLSTRLYMKKVTL